MSDIQNTLDHAEEHTGPIKTPQQLLMAVVYSFVVPVFGIIGLAYVVGTHFKPIAGANDSTKSIEQRIAKIGTVEIKDENAPLATGEDVYKAQCVACHGIGALGSPKFEDKAAWGTRITKGYDALLVSALKGKGNMTAQGGGNYNDIEIGRALVYMANAGGAHFAVPDRTAAPAAASATK